MAESLITGLPACKAALGTAILGLIFAVIGIATPEWTVEGTKKIGLWVLYDEAGESYYWTEQWKYEEDFYYSDWMQACRGLIMCGVMVGGLGILYNMYVVAKGTVSKVSGRVLTFYYLLSAFLLIITAAVYCSLIPQAVWENGEISYYKYRGGYGYSIWLCWIGGGFFLLPAAYIYEGAKQNVKFNKDGELASDNLVLKNELVAQL